jgi:UDP-2-acetamido-3-amino-2,3-dideoxy-glucuronate N-acetyltransferase
MKKLGLIGAGYWGKNLVRDFYKLNVLKTVCDKDIDILEQHKLNYPNIIITTQWENILNDAEITSICISLPAELHYKFAKTALLKDKDVYIEKPITLNIDEVQELINIAKNNNKILMVGHLLNYHPVIIKIKEQLKNGLIGNIKHIISNRLNLGKFRTNENALWSLAPHDISIILSFLNNKLPDKIKCNGFSLITKDIHDTTNTILEYDNNIYVNINSSWLSPYKERKLTIIGDKGMIVFDDVKHGFTVYKDYLGYKDNIPITTNSTGVYYECDDKLSPLTIECKHFIDCCINRNNPLTDGEEGLRVLKVLTSCQNSLINNGQIIYPNKINNTVIDKQSPIYIHPTATIDDGASIGNGTKIYHYTHISSDCIIGQNCNIGQNVYIAPGVVLGNGCKVQNNVSIYKGVICEDYVFFGPSCVLTNDLNPRAQYSKNGNYIETYIEKCATIGANATIICGNRIGHHALIGAGAVVTKNIEPNQIVVGNPAKVIGTIDEYGNINK